MFNERLGPAFRACGITVADCSDWIDEPCVQVFSRQLSLGGFVVVVISAPPALLNGLEATARSPDRQLSRWRPASSCPFELASRRRCATVCKRPLQGFVVELTALRKTCAR